MVNIWRRFVYAQNLSSEIPPKHWILAEQRALSGYFGTAPREWFGTGVGAVDADRGQASADVWVTSFQIRKRLLRSRW
jgi:hypothetical protein